MACLEKILTRRRKRENGFLAKHENKTNTCFLFAKTADCEKRESAYVSAVRPNRQTCAAAQLIRKIATKLFLHFTLLNAF